MNQETNKNQMEVPAIEELKAQGAGAIAIEAVEHAKAMEFARNDADQSARQLIDSYDQARTAELDKAQKDVSMQGSERLAQIRANLEARRAQTRVMGPDGQPTTLTEHAEQVRAHRDGAL